MKQKQADSGSILNRQARRDYQISKTYLAGIVLSGAEVKSLRTNHGHLRGAFVNIKDDELWLFNATINATNSNKNALSETEQTRPRKLLVKSKELGELGSAKDQGLTIIPLKVFIKTRYIKIEIATAKGLKKYDKRQKIKKRDTERDVNRTLKR
ncbi:MAG: SsrA-binding protein SmpB [Candidatus Saccharibacteria bacterium]